jgi:hypothetical protein
VEELTKKKDRKKKLHEELEKAEKIYEKKRVDKKKERIAYIDNLDRDYKKLKKIIPSAEEKLKQIKKIINKNERKINKNERKNNNTETDISKSDLTVMNDLLYEVADLLELSFTSHNYLSYKYDKITTNLINHIAIELLVKKLDVKQKDNLDDQVKRVISEIAIQLLTTKMSIFESNYNNDYDEQVRKVISEIALQTILHKMSNDYVLFKPVIEYNKQIETVIKEMAIQLLVPKIFTFNKVVYDYNKQLNMVLSELAIQLISKEITKNYNEYEYSEELKNILEAKDRKEKAIKDTEMNDENNFVEIELSEGEKDIQREIVILENGNLIKKVDVGVDE